MMFQHLIALAFIGLAAAHPLGEADIVARDGLSSTSNSLKEGSCKDVTLIFARGSTEVGNMGTVIGPPLCANLESKLGADKVACQGVGDPYDATLSANFLPKNTSPEAISAATTLFELAASKCPDTQVVAGGYSQGTAVMDWSIQNLPDNIKSQVKGAVLFGFTRNVQDGGRIPNYPPSQTKVYCAVGDLVCDGTLIITAAHMTYGDDASNAADFLISQLD
ncbi:hypothetical protein PHISP_07924 [Aspergillus sp. HF37]|nr:hypothetical protein PHISP_07924 [Aspergillus sp. HF37]